MKLILISLAVAAAAYAAFALSKNGIVKRDMPITDNSSIPATFEPVAVLELFTSQGCSSCPPADRLLEKTVMNAGGKRIYALSFHVDYWNRLGWKDPFSQHAFSLRQGNYASRFGEGPYTPQLVVNGVTQFVGSDQADLQLALKTALYTKSEAVFSKLKMSGADNGTPEAEYALEGDYQNCTVNFALLSLSETTRIQRGENEGVTLTNAHVTRQLISTPAQKEGKVTFQPSPLPERNNRTVIAFIQRNTGGKIIGAAELK